jgi:hypothetical protein
MTLWVYKKSLDSAYGRIEKIDVQEPMPFEEDL